MPVIGENAKLSVTAGFCCGSPRCFLLLMPPNVLFDAPSTVPKPRTRPFSCCFPLCRLLPCLQMLRSDGGSGGLPASLSGAEEESTRLQGGLTRDAEAYMTQDAAGGETV